MKENTLKTLYLCYFGLREPLVQTQVLPYLREIKKGGVRVSILTFEPDPDVNWTAEEIETERGRLTDEGIEWEFLTYHKSPSAPATAFDIMCGIFYARQKVKTDGIDVLHARAHIPLAMALPVKMLTKCRIIFDIRGLIAEEYADAGVWQENSIPFRIIKSIERAGLKRADQIVVLTKRMRDYLVGNKLRPAASIEVIPCCVDFSRADEAAQIKSERFELIYAGTVTGLYMLKEMGEFFLALKERRKDAFFRILTASPPEFVGRTFDALGIDRADYAVDRADPKDVLTLLKKAHLAISFRRPTFSQIAASPTKIPEYLAVGLPVVSNAKIGDMDTLIEEFRLGAVVEKFDRPNFEKAADRALRLLSEDDLAERCVATAEREFDLTGIGGENYLKVYRRIEENLTK